MALETAQFDFLTVALRLVAAPRRSSPGSTDAAAAAATTTAQDSPAEAPLPGAHAAWTGMRQAVDQRLGALKQAVRAEFHGEDNALMAEVARTMDMLDVILVQLDHRLAAELLDAHATTDEARRAQALSGCRALVAQHRAYIDSEPLIAHIDANPLGVDTRLRELLDGCLDRVEGALVA